MLTIQPIVRPSYDAYVMTSRRACCSSGIQLYSPSGRRVVRVRPSGRLGYRTAYVTAPPMLPHRLGYRRAARVTAPPMLPHRLCYRTAYVTAPPMLPHRLCYRTAYVTAPPMLSHRLCYRTAGPPGLPHRLC